MRIGDLDRNDLVLYTGSLKMRLRILKDNMILSEYQKEILIGLLLGDGCLEKSKKSSAARLKVDQSIKQLNQKRAEEESSTLSHLQNQI